jgi:hypothetical protein
MIDGQTSMSTRSSSSVDGGAVMFVRRRIIPHVNPDWRLTIEFSGVPPSKVLRPLAEAIGDKPPYGPHGRKVVFYGADSTAARSAFDNAAQQVDARQVLLERWDPDQEDWLSVEDTGAPTTPARRDRLSTFRNGSQLVAGIATVNVLLGAFIYFVPGMAGSPNAGHLHSLGNAVLVVAIADAVLGAFFYKFRTRS